MDASGHREDSTFLALSATIGEGGGGAAINALGDTNADASAGPAPQPCLFLLYAEGGRPTAPELKTALARSGVGAIGLQPGLREPGGSSEDWLEIVIDGLAFDVLGLAPGPSLDFDRPRHWLGLPARTNAAMAAIGIAPGPHLRGAANALPVVRTLLRLSAGLLRHGGEAIGAFWHPAAIASGREAFLALVEGWLDGGAFPAPLMISMTVDGQGAMTSEGLQFFSGQEILLDPALCVDGPAGIRLAMRLLDHLTLHEPVSGEALISDQDNGVLKLIGTDDVVRVTRAR